MECLPRRKHERHWSLVTFVLGALAAALLTWMLIANRRQRREQLRLANQDPLTLLPNRRCTAKLASAALESASVTLRPVTIALIDLNHLKSFSNHCGQEVGDYVLKEFARRACARLRTSETLGRWGPEVLLLILPDTTLHAAVATLGRLRTVTGDIPLPDVARGLKVTFSAGLASRTGNVQSLNEVIASAEAALYEARQRGLNLWLRLDHEICQTATSGVLRSLYAEPDAGRTTTQEHRGRACSAVAGIPTWDHSNQAIDDRRLRSSERARRTNHSLS
jgi:diguanylate cyclase (GGDEF)-like protein